MIKLDIKTASIHIKPVTISVMTEQIAKQSVNETTPVWNKHELKHKAMDKHDDIDGHTSACDQSVGAAWKNSVETIDHVASYAQMILDSGPWRASDSHCMDSIHTV